MDSNISFFSLPFVDSESSELNKTSNGGVYGCLGGGLVSHDNLLGSDDVLAQFLTDGPLEEPDLNGPTTLHCEICKKQFDNAKKYYGHLRVHSKDNLWMCDKCPDLKFSTKQQLMKHSLTHKPLERVWQCPQCNMAFEALYRLQQHWFSKHLGYRPHKCNQCSKGFAKLSDLKKHENTHKGIKPIECNVCKMKFTDKSNMTRHMLRHTKEKPFSCQGCGTKFSQVASMRRHIKNCALFKKKEGLDKPAPASSTVQYKSISMEPTRNTSIVPSTEVHLDKDKTNQMALDSNRTVDNIVDDILSAEDDYMTIPPQNDFLNAYSNHRTEADSTADNLMHIELLKDMSQLHALDDELFYNDIDFDSLQASHIFNTNTTDIDYGANDRNGDIQFDFADSPSIDQDIMSALDRMKPVNMTDEFLTMPPVTETAVFNSNSTMPTPTVSVNECSTIFESDVDLEASSNLAANLNLLIGENNVQYISTEDDDTFIIRLNSEIDAEQLTDMLNIGVESSLNVDYISIKNERPDESEDVDTSEPIVVKIEQPSILTGPKPTPVEMEDSNAKNKKSKTKHVLLICRTCNKVFNKKENYRSHIALHNPALRKFKCSVCDKRFSYRSTMNKHYAAAHQPKVTRAFQCRQCEQQFKAQWMLKTHMERDHGRLTPHACLEPGCGKRFYKKYDLRIHTRFRHTGERPHQCEICLVKFAHPSHLRRHERTVDCTKQARKNELVNLITKTLPKKSTAESIILY